GNPRSRHGSRRYRSFKTRKSYAVRRGNGFAVRPRLERDVGGTEERSCRPWGRRSRDRQDEHVLAVLLGVADGGPAPRQEVGGEARDRDRRVLVPGRAPHTE